MAVSGIAGKKPYRRAIIKLIKEITSNQGKFIIGILTTAFPVMMSLL